MVGHDSVNRVILLHALGLPLTRKLTVGWPARRPANRARLSVTCPIVIPEPDDAFWPPLDGFEPEPPLPEPPLPPGAGTPGQPETANLAGTVAVLSPF